MRDHGMFGFLSSEASNKGIGLDLIQEFAKEASAAFFGKDQTPLNYTIQNISKNENLTPDHISILCQEANKNVHAHLFKTSEDKYTEFELADPSVIVSNLDQSLSKTASANNAIPDSFSDDFSHAPYEKTAHVTGDFQFIGSKGHDGLKVPTEHLKKIATHKKIAELKDIEDEQLILGAQIESLENKIIKLARNQLLPLPLKTRHEGFKELGQFFKSAGLKDEDNLRLLKLAAVVMERQGLLEKTADLKVSPELISENLNADVRNGNHPLEIHIKTLASKAVRREALLNKYNLIKTDLSDDPYYDTRFNNGAILGQRVKEL